MNRYLLRLCAYVLAISIISAACSMLAILPDRPGIVRLNTYSARLHKWSDSDQFAGLDNAIMQSIRYYQKVSPETQYIFDGIQYSPEEMILSMKLFQRTIRQFPGENLSEKLAEKFIFFASNNEEGTAFFTGYYEPVIKGSHLPSENFSEPLYGVPNDLVVVDLAEFNVNADRNKIIGRLKDNKVVPFDTRSEIVYAHSLKDRAHPIAYLDEVDLFFLQIQGSGIITFPDGTMKRVNYAQKNGHPYRSIGRLLKDRIPQEKMSLQSIREYIHDHPGETRKILSYNESYVFFREVPEGPLGSIEVPLTPNRSVAMDTRLVPDGCLAYIETSYPVFDGNRLSGWRPAGHFALVQDTGGAIRGYGRADIFFGRGGEAELSAGHMKQKGRIFLIAARKEYLKTIQ